MIVFYKFIYMLIGVIDRGLASAPLLISLDSELMADASLTYESICRKHRIRDENKYTRQEQQV